MREVKGRKKAKRNIGSMIGLIIIIAIIVLTFYHYVVNTGTSEKSPEQTMTEAEKLIAFDLEADYPQDPKETVQLFARIMKALYNNSADEEIEPLALKVRELYDEEFLSKNPVDSYLIKLKTDIAQWKDANRRITNYILVNEDQEQEKEVEGVKYSINYVSYTIQDNGKFTETWKVLLRLDKDKKWKILGWEYNSKES